MKKHYKPYDGTNGLNFQDAMKEAWETNVRIIYDRGYENGKQDATVNSKEAYDQGYKAGQSSVSEAYSQSCKKLFSQGYDKGYCDAGAVILTAKEKLDRVRDEVEKLARKITVFDDWMADSYKFIVNNTAQETIEKVKAWEEKTKNATDINVGNIVEFREKLKNRELTVGDELVTTDIDGEAVFVVAHFKNGKAYMVRKWLLDNSKKKPLIDDSFNAFDWLNGEYRESLPEDIREMIDGKVTLPSEKEVFRKNEYGNSEPDETEQFEWFKTVTNRVTAFSPEDECTMWWWTRTKADKVSASDFAFVDHGGIANYAAPSFTWCGLRPYFVLSEI